MTRVSFPSDDIVPSDHCREANNAYLQIRFSGGSSPSTGTRRLISGFRPRTLDLANHSLPILAGNATETEVYATLSDAFVANADLFTSPRYVFRGHRASEWTLLPTARRYKTPHARDYFDSCRTRFIEQVRPLLRGKFTHLTLEALCLFLSNQKSSVF